MKHDGLVGAVTARLRSMEPDRYGMKVVVDVPYRGPDRRWPERIELAAYFLISEALQNAIKHSGASTVWISVEEVDAALRVRIDDDGGGWPPSGPDGGGRGMINMRTRVELLKGSLTTDRSPRGGARVEAVLPLPRYDERPVTV
jgi:signal transduction histidine kinase